MGHKTEPKGLDELIADARTTTRELREAMADSKARQREFEEAVAMMRAEAVQYSHKIARALVDELVRREFGNLQDELRGLVLKVEDAVNERAMTLMQQYLQQEIDDAPSVPEMFAARRTLARWARARGELPVGHARGQFNLDFELGETVRPAESTPDRE